MPIVHLEDGIPPSKSRMVIIEEIYTDEVLSAGYKDYLFTPPVGYLWQINSMYLKAAKPTGAASGTHTLTIASAVAYMIEGESVFGSDIEWNRSMWKTADSSKSPTTETAALQALRSTLFDSNNRLRIRYQNQSNVSTTAARQIEFVIKETPKI